MRLKQAAPDENDEVIRALQDAPAVYLYGSLYAPGQKNTYPVGCTPGMPFLGYAVEVEGGHVRDFHPNNISGVLIFLPDITLSNFSPAGV